MNGNNVNTAMLCDFYNINYLLQSVKTNNIINTPKTKLSTSCTSFISGTYSPYLCQGQLRPGTSVVQVQGLRL